MTTVAGVSPEEATDELLRGLIVYGAKEGARLCLPFPQPDGDVIELGIERSENGYRVHDGAMTAMRISVDDWMDKKHSRTTCRILARHDVSYEDGTLAAYSGPQNKRSLLACAISILRASNDLYEQLN